MAILLKGHHHAQNFLGYGPLKKLENEQSNNHTAGECGKCLILHLVVVLVMSVLCMYPLLALLHETKVPLDYISGSRSQGVESFDYHKKVLNKNSPHPSFDMITSLYIVPRHIYADI